ncbi:MAG TPA: ABC transporter ATP-binding protein [Chloroflexota bacterium]|nr:ABC transporter ATP-binding protein [Chloroflexota bacterium]
MVSLSSHQQTQSSPPSSPQPAVQVEHLVKRYGDRTAVDDLSFEVQSGEVFALLGPNGAGKTTTIEILEGFRVPDGGKVSVLGRNPRTQARELKQHVGIMLQDGGLYPAITPEEALTLFATFYREARPAAELLRVLGLEEVRRTRYRRLSGGERQRLRLALALLNRPRLIFLDEPTAGLDPQARRSVWTLIEDLRSQGVTVVLTTHYLEEAERLSDQVSIIDHGRVIAAGRPHELTRRGRSDVFVRGDSPLSPDLLTAVPSALSAREQGAGWIVETRDTAAFLTEITHAAQRAGVRLTELRVGAASLEDVYLQLTERRDAE